MITYVAYHKEHEYEPFGGSDFFTSKAVEQGSDCFVVSGSKNGSNSTVSYRLDGKYRISEVSQNTTGKFPKEAWHLQLVQLVKPSNSIPLDVLPAFDKDLFRRYFTSGGGFRAINEKTEVFHELFDSMLGTNEDQQAGLLLTDLDEIDACTDEENDPTERLDNRMSRIGQGKFRRNAISTWGGEEKCAVTGINLPALLTASHIIPWSEDVAQRKHGCNGILLSAHFDRLFDRHLIGFKVGLKPDVFTLAVSPCLSDQFADLAKIGVTTRSVLDLSNVKFSDRPRLESNLRIHLNIVLNNR